MGNGWTKTHRETQANAIQKWKPWEESTGPATEAGKAVVSQNSTKHGMRGREWRTLEKAIEALLAETDTAIQDIKT